MRSSLIVFFSLISFLTSAQLVKDTLVVGFTSSPPFIIQEEGQALKGINIWLWNQVAEGLNQPFVLQEMAFADMLDALKDGTIDLSINPLTITAERHKTMEFSESYYASNATVAIAQQGSLQKLLAFVKGFLNTNFLRGFLALILIIAIFGLAGWYFERKNNPQFRKNYKGIWDGLWWSMVTLTTVGYGDKSPISTRGKFTALFLMFTGLLFISGLTASIASSLTVNQLSSTENSFASFKEQRVGTVNNTSTDGFLRDHFFNDVRLYDGVLPGAYALRDGEIDAFIYDEPIMRYRVSKDSSLSEISILPLKFDVQSYAFGLPKERDTLEQVVSQKILEIIESQTWQVVLNEYGLSEL
jgi:ABC-type amino acid transport substrate-binding protein